jgi:hypothetical protein
MVSVANDPPPRPSSAFPPRIILATFSHKSCIAIKSLPVGLFSFTFGIDVKASQSHRTKADIAEINNSLCTLALPVPAFTTLRGHNSLLQTSEGITPSKSFIQIPGIVLGQLEARNQDAGKVSSRRGRVLAFLHVL